MNETADTVAIRVVSETEAAQRNILAYGASVQRTMTGVEVAVTRAAETTAQASARKSEAFRKVGGSVVGITGDLLAGKDAFRVLGEQGVGLASSLVGLGGTVGRVAGFFAGPWVVGVTTAVSVVGMFTTALAKNDEAARSAEESARRFAERHGDIGLFIDLTTGKLKEQNKALIENAILQRQKQVDANNATVGVLRGQVTSAIRRAAIIEPTEEERALAERGGVAPRLQLDPKLIALTAKSVKTEEMYRELGTLLEARPELKEVYRLAEANAAQIELLRRDSIVQLVQIQGLRGDASALAPQAAPAKPATMPPVTGGAGPIIASFANGPVVANAASASRPAWRVASRRRSSRQKPRSLGLMQKEGRCSTGRPPNSSPAGAPASRGRKSGNQRAWPIAWRR